MSIFIKYDDIPFQDFLSAYHIYLKKSQKDFLIDIDKLRECLFKGNKTKILDSKPVIRLIKIFYIIDFDIIRSTYNHYFIFQSSADFQEELERVAKRIKIELKLKNIDSLFRIDPKYGLVIGTAKEAIDSSVPPDKLFCFITLYLTGDQHHPEIALLEYIEKTYKKKYMEIFEKHNHCSPGSFKFLGIDLSKIKQAFKKSSPFVLLRYEGIIELGNSLIHKHKLEDLSISLIFEEVTENEITRCLLDKNKSAYYSGELCKFFINAEELLSE